MDHVENIYTKEMATNQGFLSLESQLLSLSAHPWSYRGSRVGQGWSNLAGIKHQLLRIFQPNFLKLNSSSFQIALSLGVFPGPKTEDAVAKFSGWEAR